MGLYYYAKLTGFPTPLHKGTALSQHSGVSPPTSPAIFLIQMHKYINRQSQIAAAQ